MWFPGVQVVVKRALPLQREGSLCLSRLLSFPQCPWLPHQAAGNNGYEEALSKTKLLSISYYLSKSLIKILNRSRPKTVLQELLPTLPPPQSQNVLQSFQKCFLPTRVMRSWYIFSIHCNIASALYSQPSKNHSLGNKAENRHMGLCTLYEGLWTLLQENVSH